MTVPLQKIYKKRFDDPRQREIIWKTLVNDFFQKYIRSSDTVLEVASGYGEFINNVRCKKKLAVDLNPQAEKFADKNVKIYIESSTAMKSIKSASIDKIFVSNFFEHLTRDDIIKTVIEFKRVLKTGGSVLILQPNIRFLATDFWMFFDHLTPIDDRALEEVFSVYGFKLKQKILKFLPYTTKSRFPQSTIFIKIYLKLPFLWSIFGKQSFFVFKKQSFDNN